MPKILRVCLAMGGGVSLGSFSGSALTEALKLLLIFGKDEEGEPYSNVVVDGMSGASAGAMALTIMLRCLVDYKSMLLIWKPTELQDAAEKQTYMAGLETSLKEQVYNCYFNGDENALDALGEAKVRSLIALELAQEVQKVLWVNKISAEKLYGDKVGSDYQQDPNDSFGLLERRYMEELIKTYLIGGDLNLENRTLLDPDRVLFACSLTNIISMPLSVSNKKKSRLDQNVINSTGVFNHSEVRVIDYVFNEANITQKPSDKRWLKFTADHRGNHPMHFDLMEDEAWAVISASALACGAFPIAFSPVLLRRYEDEYYIGLPDRPSEWPNEFQSLQNQIDAIAPENRNSYYGDEEESTIDYKSFNFPYVDGGTFNNEPIKEAYRIASFQDFKRPNVDVERLVLFVDPIVRKEQTPSFEVRSFNAISGGERPNKSTEISKFVASVSSLIGLLKDQGRIKESDKIFDTKENLALKEVMFNYLDGNENISLSSRICIEAFSKIRSRLADNIISIGTRQPIIYFLERLRLESEGNWEGHPFDQLEQNSDNLKEFLLDPNAGDIPIENIHRAFGIADHSPSKQIFARTVFKVIAEVSLDTAGKNPKATNAAILPINMQENIIDLPGTEIAAFAGFSSLSSKEYAFEYGRFSALLSLKSNNGYRKVGDENLPYIKDNEIETLANVEKKLKTAIRDTKFYSEDNDYPASLRLGLFKPSIERIKVVLKSAVPQIGKVWKVPISLAAGVSGFFIGLKNISKWKYVSISNFLHSTADSLAEKVEYVPNVPLTLSIINVAVKHKWWQFWRNKKTVKLTLHLANDTKEERIAIVNSSEDQNGSKQIWLRLFLLKDFSGGYRRAGEQMLPQNLHEAPRLKIVADHQNQMPFQKDGEPGLDPNLDATAWAVAYRNLFPKNVVKISIAGVEQEIQLKSDYYNDPSKTLFHSLCSHEFHVNPTLELDLADLERSWYFKENTISFDKKLL